MGSWDMQLRELTSDTTLKSLIESALARVRRKIREGLSSDFPVLDRMCRHLELFEGKMLRPGLLILSGLAVHDGVGHRVEEAMIDEAHITAAAVCEMIHMATLVHDDVLDEAERRRYGQTINKLYGNESAVLLGDYLFAAAYRLSASLAPMGAGIMVGEVGMTLCAGELLQILYRGDFTIDERTYFRIIEQKTASLIGAACQAGAAYSRGSDNTISRLHGFGLRLGTAFQIQDDILDLTADEAALGKPVQRDIAMGKLTLPLVHHLSTTGPEQHRKTLALLGQKGGGEGEWRLQIFDALASTGSIAYARSTAEALVNDAKAMLSDLTESAPKSMLLALADKVLDM
jgi:octaprenyl-diphosphate synthase